VRRYPWFWRSAAGWTIRSGKLRTLASRGIGASGRKVIMAGIEPRSVFDIPPDEAEEARLDAQAEAEIDAGAGFHTQKCACG